jgi:hypothetical protein
VGEFLQSMGDWLDPAVFGTLILQWSGRVLAALQRDLHIVSQANGHA